MSVRINDQKFLAPFITVMQPDEMKKHRIMSADKGTLGITRITVSVPNADYEHLLRIAENKRVSISWVVRDAVEKYLSADIPLFAKTGTTSL
jgi:hypothetical protein